MTVLVRYGAIPENARFESGDFGDISRGTSVVVSTHRGTELAVSCPGLRRDREGTDLGTPTARVVFRGARAQSLPAQGVPLPEMWRDRGGQDRRAPDPYQMLRLWVRDGPQEERGYETGGTTHAEDTLLV